MKCLNHIYNLKYLYNTFENNLIYYKKYSNNLIKFSEFKYNFIYLNNEFIIDKNLKKTQNYCFYLMNVCFFYTSYFMFVLLFSIIIIIFLIWIFIITNINLYRHMLCYVQVLHLYYIGVIIIPIHIYENRYVICFFRFNFY